MDRSMSRLERLCGIRNNCDGEGGAEGDDSKSSEDANSTNGSLDGLFIKGQRPLIFCAIMGLEEIGEELLKRHEKIKDYIDEVDGYDYTALHHAANLGCSDLVRALLQAKANVNATTDQIASTLFVPGGRSALHLAGSNGCTDTISALLEFKAQIDLRDFEGEPPLAVTSSKAAQKLLIRAARNHYHFEEEEQKEGEDGEEKGGEGNNGGEEEISAEEGRGRRGRKASKKERKEGVERCRKAPSDDLIKPLSPNEFVAQEKIRAANTKKRRLRRLDITERKALHSVHTFRSVWSDSTCDWMLKEVLKVTKERGWTSKRHRQHSTTDIPVYEVESVHGWIRESLFKTVFPMIAKAFELLPQSLRIRDAFFVKYDVNGQKGLGFHRDGTLLSCNVLLNKASEFKGGGTVFQESDIGRQVVTGKRGDFVAHSGQLLHGGNEVTEGVRYILVVFIDVRDYCA